MFLASVGLLINRILKKLNYYEELFKEHNSSFKSIAKVLETQDGINERIIQKLQDLKYPI